MVQDSLVSSERQLVRQILVDAKFCRLLLWWLKPHIRPGVPWRQPEPQLDRCTDASYQGWGAYLNDLTVSGTWKRRWQSKHINVLELEAFRRALQALATHVSGQCVRLFSDNPTTVSCLRREGGTKSLELTDITRQILLWADAHDTTLLPIRISGVRNVRAVFLSRERKPP